MCTISKRYLLFIQKNFGPITLPSKSDQLGDILETLKNSLESVTLEDYHLLQAIKIIESWGKEHGYAENETRKFN